MKKLFTLIIIFTVFIFSGYSQVIPVGNSQDSVTLYNVYKHWTFGPKNYEVYYYKSTNYNSLTSPILWYMHGTGGTGAEGSAILTDIAERRDALIIAPTFPDTWGDNYVYAQLDYYEDTCFYFTWLPPIFKQIYRHVLLRENRDTIPVYLTGFSAGGQCVTRYMLVRQAIPDSIPIKMTISVNPYSYTFCTDYIDSIAMPYPCGIGQVDCGWYDCFNSYSTDPLLDFNCNQHVLQYYNENYGILIGTADTVYATGWCWTAQGTNRYERALNFYNFSDTNAVTRGTSLQWQYTEVPEVGHDGYALYNTKAMPTDTVTIAEALLFDTPYHIVPDFSPLANFSYADSGLTIDFLDLSLYSEIWHWDFGDGDTSIIQNPQHTYAVSGTYYVCLTSGDSCINDTYCDSITVTAVGINYLNLRNVRIFPNPTTGLITIEAEEVENVEVLDIAGRQIYTGRENKIDLSIQPKGIYIIKVTTSKGMAVEKVIRN